MIENTSLEISNYWTSSEYLTESNKKSGTLVAFDWESEYLTGINTNIDLGDSELTDFKFDILVDFLTDNNFNHVLGLRNVAYKDNPSEEWTDKLKETLESCNMNYDEYLIDMWPAPIPKFDLPDNIFILRYSYDENSKIDQFASNRYMFQQFLEKSDWKKCYKADGYTGIEKRTIIFISELENIILHEEYVG